MKITRKYKRNKDMKNDWKSFWHYRCPIVTFRYSPEFYINDEEELENYNRCLYRLYYVEKYTSNKKLSPRPLVSLWVK